MNTERAYICSEVNVLTRIFLPGLMSRAVASIFNSQGVLFSSSEITPSVPVLLFLALQNYSSLQCWQVQWGRLQNTSANTFATRSVQSFLKLEHCLIFTMNTCAKVLCSYSRLQDFPHLPGLAWLFDVGDAISGKRRGYFVHFYSDKYGTFYRKLHLSTRLASANLMISSSKIFT